MWELWVALMVAGAWVLAAGSAGFVGSFLVPRLDDRLLAVRVAREFSRPNAVEPIASTESGPEPTASSTLALAEAGRSSSANREMAHATSATA